MTSWAVVDSGILLASILPESISAKADAILEFWTTSEVQLAAPVLFKYELIAVIRKSVFRGF